MSKNLQECTNIRSAFSKEVFTQSATIDNHVGLQDEILQLYRLDLELAKKWNSTSAIWSSHRMIIGIWERSSGDGDDNSDVNKTRISEFSNKKNTGSYKHNDLMVGEVLCQPKAFRPIENLAAVSKNADLRTKHLIKCRWF